MAAQKLDKKRRKKRKARTEVSSDSSSSSSDSDSSSPPRTTTRASTSPQARSETEKPVSPSRSPAEEETVASTPPRPQQATPMSPDQAFESFYLKQATKEFSDDLDKLRSAPDFKAGSVPILIEALRQGTATFGVEERERVGGAAVQEGG